MSLQNKTSIALVDDHRLFRKGITVLIQSFENYQVLFDVGSGEEFFERLSNGNIPQIVLLDLNMPIMNGLQVAKILKEDYPEIAVIVLSMVEDSESVISLVKTGIKGYLLKDSEPAEFKMALDEVVKKNVYFPSFVSKYMAESLNIPSDESKLNQREREFLILASSELTYKEIADKMFVSTRTIDGYRENLFNKLNIKNRVGLVLYAIKNKIVEF